MTKTGIGALALAAALSVIGTLPAEAQTYTVLHNFAGGPADGANSLFGRPIGDSGGNLYGVTYYGGASGVGAFGFGAVFKLNSTGHESVLHSFAGPPTDGANPDSDLVRDFQGNLYGTTLSGGASNLGTVFKLDPAGNVTILHSFAGYPTDGSQPTGGLIRDFAGNLYGTASSGGPSGFGMIFKLDPTGKITILHNFAGGPADGQQPWGDMVRDFAGNLFGTTEYGGASGSGVVFKLDPAGKETVLHSFAGPPTDGINSVSGLVRDFAGNLYGATYGGGASDFGVVFKLDANGNETVLHSFAGGPADGTNPTGDLVRDLAGNLYGTTLGGGASGVGVFFKLDSTGKLTILHSFAGPEGLNPTGGLVSFAGSFYGTTQHGSSLGLGVVFRLKP